jgi:hypothetical protein
MGGQDHDLGGGTVAKRLHKWIWGTGILAVVLSSLTAAPAGATTATATITAGTLAFVSAPPNVNFSATLNGLNQTVTATQALDVSDATGSGAGWNITATSTTFATGGGPTLATTSTTVQSGPTRACDSGSSCTLATNSVSYPSTLPAGASAPTATKVFNAAANTGEGNQTVTVTWSLAVPAATYTSTWTISLASGP